MSARGAFGSMIHLADAVVMDTPATSLVQVLQGSARVYVYNTCYHWEPGILEVLQRTCCVSDDFDSWAQSFRRDIASGRAFEPRLDDPELIDCLADPMVRAGGPTRATAQMVSAIACESQAIESHSALATKS